MARAVAASSGRSELTQLREPLARRAVASGDSLAGLPSCHGSAARRSAVGRRGAHRGDRHSGAQRPADRRLRIHRRVAGRSGCRRLSAATSLRILGAGRGRREPESTSQRARKNPLAPIFGPCDGGEVAGEVVAIISASGDGVTRQARAAASGLDCRSTALQYAGLFPLGERFVLADQMAVDPVSWQLSVSLRGSWMLPSVVMQAAGRSWAACVATPGLAGFYRGTVANSYRGGQAAGHVRHLLGPAGAQRRHGRRRLRSIACRRADFGWRCARPGGHHRCCDQCRLPAAGRRGDGPGRSDGRRWTPGEGGARICPMTAAAANLAAGEPRGLNVVCFVTAGERSLTGSVVGIGENADSLRQLIGQGYRGVMDRRVAGIAVLVLALVAVVVVPSISGRRVVGTAVGLTFADPPKVGECIAPLPAGVVEKGGGTPEVPVSRHRVRQLRGIDRRRGGRRLANRGGRAGRPERLPAGWPLLPAGSRFRRPATVLAIYGRLRHALRRRCLLETDDRLQPDQHRARRGGGRRRTNLGGLPRGSDQGGELPGDAAGRLCRRHGCRMPSGCAGIGTIWTLRPTLLHCDEPHAAELLATGWVQNRAKVSTPEIEASCRSVAGRIMRTADPTRQGAISIVTDPVSRDGAQREDAPLAVNCFATAVSAAATLRDGHQPGRSPTAAAGLSRWRPAGWPEPACWWWRCSACW